MKSIYVCQIYDSLSEKVIHTFMASNQGHARDQYKRFLDSVIKYSDPHNFKLIYVFYGDVCESETDCVNFIADHPEDVDCCEDVGFCVEVENESEN